MFKPTLIAAIGAALALTGIAASPALAQSYSPQEAQAQQPSDRMTQEVDDAAQGRSRSTSDSRIRRGRGAQQPAAPTPEANIAAAQAIATSAGVGCQVTEANLLGQTAERARSYEAACSTGPGFILVAGNPPQAIDCVLLAGQAEIDRTRDPAAEIGRQCVLPQNADVVRVVAAYAAEAGIPCTVDQGSSIGKAASGNLVYEVGCNGADGYWLERVETGWTKTECSVIITRNATCRFSTPAEAATTLKTRFAGSEASACDVTEGRYMGANANGSFYEAKCGAGNGVIVRFDPAFAVQQVYPCEVAHRIGGGCRLTVVPEAPAAS